MIKARKNVARARSMMAPGNPVPSWTEPGSWYDQRGLETLDRVLADTGEPAGKRVRPVRSTTVRRPERLTSDEHPTTGRRRSAGATRWLAPVAVACAVAVIAATAAVLGQHASRSGAGPAQGRGHGRLRILATIRVSEAGTQPSAIAVNLATGVVYVTVLPGNVGQHGTVAVINTRTNTVTDRITVQRYPDAIAVDSRTDTIYVANQQGTSHRQVPKSGTISVIDGHTNEVTATIRVPGLATLVAVDQQTDKIYVAYSLGTPQGNTVSVIDGHTNKIVATISLGRHPYLFPFDMAVDPSTDTIYTADLLDNAPSRSVSVIDGRTNKVTATVKVSGVAPIGLAVNAPTDTIYVATQGKNAAVSVINGHTDRVIAAIHRVLLTTRSDDPPSWVAVDPRTNVGYVGALHLGLIAVIDGRTHAVTTRVAVKTVIPVDMAINPATEIGYTLDLVTNFSNPGTISVLSLPATGR